MKNNSPVYRFPIEEYREAGLSLLQEKKTAEKEKGKWLKIRARLTDSQKQLLDQEFKSTFEALQGFFYRLSPFEDAESILEELKLLVARGAGAGLLDAYELGGFNVVGIAKAFLELRAERELLLATDIIRLAIVAEADMIRLKAYAGNGGAPALYWICEYLSLGIGPDWSCLKDEIQYKTCFRVFSLILAGAPEAAMAENYCAIFLSRLRPDPAVGELQRQVHFRLLHSSLVKSSTYSSGMFFGLSTLIKNNSEEWWPLLFPYPEKELNTYVNFLQEEINEANAGLILNGFKATREGRKKFNSYFSWQQHWFLSHILQTQPDTLFRLVRGHELEMLEPFLKNYKQELIGLRDKKGNTLLHAAVLSGNSPEKIIKRLLSAGFSFLIPNKEGETAKAIAQRKNMNVF